MNIHKHGNRYDLPTLAKNHRTLHVPPEVGLGSDRLHHTIKKSPVRPFALATVIRSQGSEEWGEELLFLEMNKNAGDFFQVYIIVNKLLYLGLNY